MFHLYFRNLNGGESSLPWAMQPTEKLSELGIVLPSAPKAAGLYKPVILDQNLLYFSGHLPLLSDGVMITGKLGADFSTEKEGSRPSCGG